MRETATIQQDVDNPEEIEEVIAGEGDDDSSDVESDDTTEFVSDRDQMMQSLAERRRQQMKEITSSNDEDIHDEDVSQDGNDLESAVEKEETVTLKVNGQEIVKTKEEVDAAGGVAAIQKSLSGDMKLAQAAEERKRLDQERAELEREKADLYKRRQNVNQATQELQQMSQADTEEAKAARKKKATEIAENIFLGDTEKIQAAVEEILSASDHTKIIQAPSSQINEAAIVQRVTRSVTMENDRKNAVKMFETDNADLNTPGRRSYVNRLTAEIAQSNPEMMPTEIVKEAVRLTREELGIPEPEKQTVVESKLEQKKTHKRKSVDNLPAANKRMKKPQATKKPKTRQEIFNDLAGNRSHRNL